MFIKYADKNAMEEKMGIGYNSIWAIQEAAGLTQ